jgi:predicted N-formylglutamate amidohydrolase
LKTIPIDANRPAMTDTLTDTLLGPDEPLPVLEHNPGGASPFLLTCDHYGLLIPRALGDLGLTERERRRHIGWDIGIGAVSTRLADALDAHMIAQAYSRLVIDCNRPLHVPSSIPLISQHTRIPGNEGLDEEARLARRHAIFDTYHQRIAQILETRAARNQPTILLAMHSFTPEYTGIARPWHIGTLYEHDTRLPHLLLKALRAEHGLVVGDNEPYAVREGSDYTIPVHGAARGLLHTGIEIRQDLITADEGQREWAERLARIFKALEAPLLEINASALAPATGRRQS